MPQKEPQKEPGDHPQSIAPSDIEFMEMAIHELRTPLTVVNLKTEMLLSGFDGKLTKAQREALTDIDYYNKRMANILSNILSVLRIEANAYNLEPETVSLETLLEEVIMEHEPLAHEKKIAVDASGIAHGLVMEADPRFLKIIFENILSNAIRYTDSGGRIEVSARKERSDIGIRIEDTGRGIPVYEKERVFLKMFRGSNVPPEVEGTGLGLYIAKKLTELLQGEITFESEEGRGTTFFLTFKST